MLIYNYQKEFLGIDENDLKSLGFKDFTHLRSEVVDFADFFVKTPGFVHNFKHVHWIDFVTCAESNEDSKVIIHANGKNYRCTLDIRVAYLIDNPNQKAYLIHLMNLRALTHAENEQIAGDIIEKPALKTINEPKAIFGASSFVDDDFVDAEPEVQTQQVEPEVYLSNDPYETPIEESSQETYYDDSPIDLGDDFLINEKEVIEREPETKSEPEILQVQTEVNKPQVPTQVLEVGDDYVYDPHLASDELGLPVDLIEEFIQDFINQANEFKEELYASLKDNNISNLKILSHKLKGVAANLRVEDAFEVLTTINTSEDTEVIELNLNTLYVIIDRLAGKSPSEPIVEEVQEVKEAVPEAVQEELPEDEIVLSFKDEKDTFEDEPLEEIVLEAPSFDEEPVEVQKETTELLQEDELEDVEEKLEIEPEISFEPEEFIENDEDIFLEVEPEIEQKIEPEEPKEELKEDVEIETEVEPEIEQSLETEDKQSQEPFESQEKVVYEDLFYDKSLVASEIGINIEVFNELFEDYVAEASKTCNNIAEAIDNNDTALWQKNAIKLKGMSDNMRVHDIVAELKSIIHTSDTDIAKKALGIVSSKLEQISKVEV